MDNAPNPKSLLNAMRHESIGWHAGLGELDENTQRIDLDSYEASKQRLTEIRQAEADAKREAQEFRGDSPQKSRGRPKGGRREAARRVGLDEKGVRDTERHVEAAERYPVLQGSDWKKYQAIEAGEKLDALPERERPKAAALIGQPATPPANAIRMLKNLAEMAPAQRKRVWDDLESSDARQGAPAVTRAGLGRAVPARGRPAAQLMACGSPRGCSAYVRAGRCRSPLRHAGGLRRPRSRARVGTSFEPQGSRDFPVANISGWE